MIGGAQIWNAPWQLYIKPVCQKNFYLSKKELQFPARLYQGKAEAGNPKPHTRQKEIYDTDQSHD